MSIYARWIRRWEHRLATRDTNRIVREFEWGLDWLTSTPVNGDAAQVLEDFVSAALRDSDAFYSYSAPTDYRFKQGCLTFTSPVPSPYAENNRVHADLFAVPDERRRAVLVLPQWNAGSEGHVGLCKLLNRFGISALRMSLAYHDRRMPPELQRADYHVSSNIGRTIQASRQSIIDARACLDWLEAEGYTRLAILGTSLGSCMAFITAAHDRRIRAGVFNHVSMHFGDVIWTGKYTQHVRQGFGDRITHEQLRRYWSVISPASYLERLVGREMKSMLIWARHDSTFLPVYSQQVLEWFRSRNVSHEVVTLPCAHYTTGQFPFNLYDGLAMARFLRRNL